MVKTRWQWKCQLHLLIIISNIYSFALFNWVSCYLGCFRQRLFYWFRIRRHKCLSQVQKLTLRNHLLLCHDLLKFCRLVLNRKSIDLLGMLTLQKLSYDIFLNQVYGVLILHQLLLQLRRFTRKLVKCIWVFQRVENIVFLCHLYLLVKWSRRLCLRVSAKHHGSQIW